MVSSFLELACGAVSGCLVLASLGAVYHTLQTPLLAIGTVTTFTVDIGKQAYRCAILETDVGPQVVYINPLTTPRKFTLQPYTPAVTLYRNALHLPPPYWNSRSSATLNETDRVSKTYQ